MPFGTKTDQIVVSLLTAILLAVGGLVWSAVSGHASEADLRAEERARKAADRELKDAQTELAKEVTEYIRSQERRDGKVDKLLEQLEKHMETES